MRIRFSDLSCIDVMEIGLCPCWNPSTGEWSVYVEVLEGRCPDSYTIGEMSHDIFSTREEAETKLMKAVISQTAPVISEMSVKELCAEWLTVIKNRVKQSTLANYRMKIE